MLAHSRGFSLITWALLALAGAVLLMSLGGVLASGTGAGYGWSMMPWSWGAKGAAMPLIRFAMLLFLVAASLGIVALARCSAERPWEHGVMEDDALKIARRRYARGETGAEEFARLHGELDGARRGQAAHRRITLRRQEP